MQWRRMSVPVRRFDIILVDGGTRSRCKLNEHVLR